MHACICHLGEYVHRIYKTLALIMCTLWYFEGDRFSTTTKVYLKICQSICTIFFMGSKGPHQIVAERLYAISSIHIFKF